LLKFADGLEFTAACRELRIEMAEPQRRIRPLRQPKPEQLRWKPAEWKIPSEKWRAQATKMALFGHEQLLGQGKVLSYLSGFAQILYGQAA
jgi:hypothetical protein